MGASTVTVFGGSGYLGRAVVSRLLDAGMSVQIAARHPEAVRFEFREASVRLVHADIRDPAAVTGAVAGADAVVNAVGLYVEQGAETFDAIHVAGAENVARAAGKAGITRVIHVSGIGADTASASRYVRARGEGEARVRRCLDSATILRPSVLFGPGDAFLNTIDTITRMSPVFPLFGRGDTRLQPVYVGDVAAAVAAATESGIAGGRIAELGGPRVYTYREIVRLVLRHRRRRRALVPVPFALWAVQARLMSWLPSPPLTEDQVILMGRDNVVGEGALTLEDLGIGPRRIESLLESALGP